MSFYINDIVDSGYVNVMEHAGFKASLMKSKRLVSDNDKVFGLPSGIPIPVFPIFSLPGCPDNWVREAGSYVCPVDSEWGLWFNWTLNDSLNTAIVPSVKGMNPITGQKINGFGLEMYADKCPIHDVTFSHGRVCEKCGYEWPSQNYVSYPNVLWWDGFRQPDGTVRQFFFTDKDERDVASAIIGKDNTVPAFGFLFYKTKVNRIKQVNNYYSYKKVFYHDNDYYGPIKKHYYDDSTIYCSSSNSVIEPQCLCNTRSISGVLRNSDTNCCINKKSDVVSVGAGAKIDQNLEFDNLGLDGWNDEYSAVIRLYFCFEKQFRNIVSKGGIKDIKFNKNGYLKNIPVG